MMLTFEQLPVIKQLLTSMVMVNFGLVTNNQAETPDLSGQFNLSIEACASSSCDPDEGGRVFFIADGSSLINAIYDYEGFNEGKYGGTKQRPCLLTIIESGRSMSFQNR